MECYEIVLKGVPKIVFGCSIEYENYKNQFPHTANLLEIALIEAGSILFDYGGGRREKLEPGMLSIITKEMVCTTSAMPGERQRHTTVGVVADYDCHRITVSTPSELARLKAAVYEQNHILLPLHIPLEGSYQSILHALKRIASYHTASEPVGKLKAVSRWLTMCAELTEFCLMKTESICLPPSTVQYVSRAEHYVREHYRESLTIPDIARELGISVGYLQKIFAEVTKMSIVQYLNRYRVELAKQYIDSRRLPLREIAELVGVDDPAYMSRLFRKVTGMSYLDYVRGEGSTKTEP